MVEVHSMRYEEFRAAWDEALRESKLTMIGLWSDETLNLRSTSRTYQSQVEPLGGQDAAPFFVTATLSFRWDALNTARTATKEEDMLTEMFGRDGAFTLLTERRRLRIDIKLNASLPWGKPLPMPSRAAWSAWTRETTARLGHIEPLTPIEHVVDDDDGEPEILAWQGSPRAEVSCNPKGALQLEAVGVSAMQVLQFPRTFDEPDEAPEAPEDQLREMFHRVRASLLAWMQALDHLRKK